MSIDYRERRLRFWCQKVLPLVYDESLSYYELLCKIMKHLSEAETDVSALEQWLADLDAEAVKMVYSEYPLYAVKSGNAVTLKRRSEASAPITDVANRVGIADNPIHATISTQVATGHLDPNDENSPEGTVMEEATVTLTIDEATSSAKGAMSASDKGKLDALHEVTVVAGSSGNIQVGSATTGYNRRYTVELNPNFQVNIQKDYLVGDWEWNACLNGQTNCGAWNSNVSTNAVVLQAPNFSTYNMNSLQFRQGLKGVVVPSTMNYNTATSPCIGVCYTADQNYPFATVTAADPVVDGATYFTTNNAIDLKVQLNGVGVANREFTVYLTSQSLGSGQTYSNTYLTDDDPYYPSYGVAYIPAKYNFTTDSTGYASFTIPSGLTAVAHTTSSIAPVAQYVKCLYIVAKGTPSDLYGDVRIDSCTIAVKANLN